LPPAGADTSFAGGSSLLQSAPVKGLVIGTRRTSTKRTFLGVAIGTLAVIVALFVAYVIYRRVVAYVTPDGSVPDLAIVAESKPGENHALQLRFGESSLAYRGQIPVLRLVGEPHTIGAAHGRLLGKAVTATSRVLSPSIERTVSRGGLFGGTTHTPRLRWRHRLLDDGIPGHQLLEIAGVVRGTARTEGSAPSYETFVRQQAVLDLGVPAPWSSGHAFRSLARSLSFVTALRGAEGDRLLVGRSFALPGVSDGGEACAEGMTVFFVRAESVIPFASIGWPGLVGVVSGINAEGIAVMVHPVRTADVRTTREAWPATLLARETLEHARTLEDAIGVLENKENTPLGAAAFVVVDGNARSWAVIERSPKHVAVIRNPSPAVVADVLGNEAFSDDPENDRARRTRPSSMRAQRTAQLLRVGSPSTPADVATVLRDTRGQGAQVLPLGHRGAVEELSAVHTAVFDASGMVLWVAEGPGARGRFRAFDLRHELRGEGVRPAPPADLPAATEVDASDAHAIRLARRDLRLARRARLAGSRTRAGELASRALARTPDLPEALLLAGQLARASGDQETAQRYFRRYIGLGPDDLGAAEEIRARLKDD